MALTRDIVNGNRPTDRVPAGDPDSVFQVIWRSHDGWEPDTVQGRCAGNCGGAVISPEVWVRGHDGSARGKATGSPPLVGHAKVCPDNS